MEKQFKRLPASPRKIIDINPEKDIRVRILGQVIDSNGGTIIVDDGTSTTQIVTEASCEVNDIVCVFARVLPLEDGYELRGEIVQSRAGMDMGLYRRVMG